jgi:HEAT repeat protein
MIKVGLKIFIFGLIVVVLEMLFSSSWSLVRSGKVTDLDTGQPIQGAVVAISWNTLLVSPPFFKPQFLAVKETLTDKDGKFFIKTLRFHLNIPFVTWLVESKPIIYKAGYHFIVASNRFSDIKLKKVQTSPEIRKAELIEIEKQDETNLSTTKILNLLVERENEFLQQTSNGFVSSQASNLKRFERQRNQEIRDTFNKKNHDAQIQEIESLIHALKSDQWKTRSMAANTLALIGDERMVEPLIEASKDINSQGLSEVATALGVFPNPEATASLILLLNSGDSDVRGRAVSSLGNLHDPRALNRMVDLLNDPSKSVRLDAIAALGQMESREAVIALINEWKDPDQDIRAQSAATLGHMGHIAVDPLISELTNNDSYFRWRAARALGQIRDLKAIEVLIQILNDESSEVRWSAIEALRSIRDTRALIPLQHLLMDRDTGISQKAREAIDKL